ncbi:hypothetical protein P0L94_08210 [Microbacter sp. GSS18]|nr:hypothetical protein P0L94_08210 [Microbacter sp. GSS18]
MDVDAVRATVDDVIAAMFATDPGVGRFPRGDWPHGGCEFTTVAIAAVLEDRGLGRWTFVSAGLSGEVNHAWLEWRNEDGEVIFSIDATLHQFDGWDAPFAQEGVTPAASMFSPVQYAGEMWDWPWLGDERQIFRRLIRAVREQLASS